MIGAFVGILLCLSLLFFLLRARGGFVSSSRVHLAFLPVFPISSFIHHNLDGTKAAEPRWELMLPLFLSLTLMSWHYTQFATKRTGLFMRATPLRQLCLLLILVYILLTLWSSYAGSWPFWSFYASFWTLPFAYLFFQAGYETKQKDLEGPPWLSLTVIFSCLLSFSIVAFALLSGKANSLFNTRSYGSILATTGILQLLIIYVPLAAFEQRNNRLISWLFWVCPPLLMGISLSRSALLPFVTYLTSVMFVASRLGLLTPTHITRAGLIATSVFAVSSSLQLSIDGTTWLKRFEYLPYAIAQRIERFGPYWKSMSEENPFSGVGFGLTRFHHPEKFTDLHNLALTELFENGFGAFLVIFMILVLFLVLCLRMLLHRAYWNLALGGILTVFMAHATGINLGIRNPTAYNTPYFLCVFFFVFGLLAAHSERAQAKK